jgi:hypothetical protein
MRSLVVTLFIVSSGLVFGQIEEVRRITKELCSPEFHGRGYVNKGDSLAAEFLAKEFEAVGAKPIKGSYFQRFELPVNTFPGKMSIKVDGSTLEPGIDYMVNPGCASFANKIRFIEVNAATAMNPDSLMNVLMRVRADFDYGGIALNFIDADPDTVKSLRGIGNELAGYLPVMEVVDSKFIWSVSQNQLPGLFIHIQNSAYVKDAEYRIEIDSKHIENYESQNVVARITAKKKCAKTIVFTAHYDHLGRMGSETYFPGANDNASGTAMLLTMARYFKENPVKYNVVFIAFAGEEAGLVGSKYYTENPLFKLKKIKFLVNLDIMGSGEEGITVVNATLFEEEFKKLQEINSDEDLLAKVKSRGPAKNSDHYWFTEQGVPAFFIYTMGPNKHYHDVFDKYEGLSFSEYYDITKLLTQFVRSL